MRTEPISDPVLAVVEMAGEKRHPMLIFLTGAQVNLAALSTGQPFVVGRDLPSDLVIDDRRLSRTHARFTLHEDGATATVEDLGSTNGTWIGGQRVTKVQVTPGQDVRLGATMVRLQVLGPQANEAATLDWSQNGAIVAGAAMLPVLETAARAAAARIPVLLQGETGTGKEVIARFLHARSPRAKRPLVCVNCAALPPALVESALFGHEKGAFTGASAQHRGVFEEAHGGTVFLDEIGELSAAAQAALLRVLETGTFQRVGGTREISVDVRVVAATHRDLEAMSARGEFRSDLYFRLSTLVLAIPPLRARKDEIPELCARFLKRANEANSRAIQGIAPEAKAVLAAHDWPGNVRELRNAIERAVVVTAGDTVGVADLPARVILSAAHEASASRPGIVGRPIPPDPRPLPVASDTATAAMTRLSGEWAAGRSTVPPAPDESVGSDGDWASSQANRAAPTETASGDADPGSPAADALPDRVQRFERDLIVSALDACGWRRAQAARQLGIPLRTLAYRIKTLGIEEPRK